MLHYNYLQSDSISNSIVFRKIYAECETDFILLVIGDIEINIDEEASLSRFLDVANTNAAGLVYSDYYELLNNDTIEHPTIDYQTGSIRDDFEFGPVMLLKRDSVQKFYKSKLLITALQDYTV